MLHNNVNPCSAEKIKAWLKKYTCEILQRSPHSLSVASSDFLFGILIKKLERK